VKRKNLSKIFQIHLNPIHNQIRLI